MTTAASDRGRERLLILGVYQATDAYPNTRYVIEALHRTFDVREIAFAGATRIGHLHGKVGQLRAKILLIAGHLQVLAHYLLQARGVTTYIPYPSPILLLLLSFLPRCARPPRIVADAVISLYDTMVIDRALLSEGGWAACLLWRLERRAYRTADAVVVDTPENALHYAAQFNLPVGHFHPIPLSTNETDFVERPVRPEGSGPLIVLFIGTLVPLHGIGTIVAAARLLRDRSDIHFRIVGDGQQGWLVEAAMDGRAENLEWIRAWQRSDQIADAIARADICLGVFGAGAKAGRVCPYKLYAYLSVGRAVVTAAGPWAEQTLSGQELPPFVAVPPADPEQLAAAIAALADAPEARTELARRARVFYGAELSNGRASASLEALLRDEGDESER